MRELLDIVAAFDELAGLGKPAALATVVGVEGSAYRSPGARMLISEDGRTWGGVSGGCLERDVMQRALGVIASGIPMLHRYDTADDEHLATGVSTGCGGVVHILIQRVTADAPGVIPLMASVVRDRRTLNLATISRASGAWMNLVGSMHVWHGLPAHEH
ncbi:MAG: XdhC family protein, partial [Burkholderiales bacterium]|nr:XdhC family protein [Phycisphaerae bacterium]